MELKVDIFGQFDKKWALLTAGTKDKFNAMYADSDAHDMYIGEVVEMI